jgi:choline dehydrogenase-like flavoprotein
MIRAPTYDAIIVGSGPTGGYAARTLSEAGLRVLVVDAGLSRLQSKAIWRYDELRRRLGYRIEIDPAAVRRQPIQSACYAWSEHPHAFVDDIENPYTTDPEKPFTWIRGRQVGGRIVVRKHPCQFYRLSDLDFKAGDRDGASPSWPICYADLAPYYDRIERWMRVRGTVNGIPHLPDAVLADEVGLNAGERLLKGAVERTWTDRWLIPGRTASRPLPIVDALRTGNCTLRTDAVVSRLLVDDSTAKVTGVAYVDRRSRRSREATGKIVVLCASSIESARLLLASATRQHPEGLGNSSGMVGRFLMDHTVLPGIGADMPLRDADLATASSWTYIPRFRNVGDRTSRFVRGYGIQVFTMRRECGFTAFGEMLPHPDNRVTLDRSKVDKWDIPVVKIACVHRENELAMLQDQIEACDELIDTAGFTTTKVRTRLLTPGSAIHEVGTARMGSDPKQSVLNGFCQSWDAQNLFVMDGSCFVSQGVQNPTLTMMAIAARSCDYLIDAYRRGQL